MLLLDDFVAGILVSITSAVCHSNNYIVAKYCSCTQVLL